MFSKTASFTSLLNVHHRQIRAVTLRGTVQHPLYGTVYLCINYDMPESRPPFLQRLSSYLVPHDALSAPYTAKRANENVPVVRGSSSTPQSSAHVTEAAAGAVKQKARPTLLRAATMSTPTTTTCTQASATPSLSRPVLNRAAASLSVDWISNSTDTLHEPGYGNKPGAPTYWADHLHRTPLLQMWYDLPEHPTMPTSVTEQLAIVRDRMVHQYPELGSGDRPLTKEWIEHVLGACLRHPFCNSAMVGNWPTLATAAGPRGNWGPW